MTATVKLDPQLEESLRRRAAASGCTASDIIRAALVAYLQADDVPRERSPHALGADLFGRYSAAPELASQRKRVVADAWADKHARRGS